MRSTRRRSGERSQLSRSRVYSSPIAATRRSNCDASEASRRCNEAGRDSGAASASRMMKSPNRL